MQIKDEFYGNVLKMFTGTVGAYMFWALAMLVVGRLYAPEYFGGGQLFVSAASFLATMATGRYETAITIPRFRFRAIHLVLFSMALSILFAAIFALLLLICSDLVSRLVVGVPAGHLLLVPCYMMELCFFVLFYAWMIRTKKYAAAAKGLILFPLSYLAFCLIFYYVETSWHKLVMAILLARGIEVLYYGYYLYRDMRRYAGRISWRHVLRQGKAYADFPKYQLPGGFIDSAQGNGIPFLITAFWGLETTGHYSMATQVLAAPAGLLAKAVGDVFRQEGARLYGKYKACGAFYRKNLYLSIAYSVLVCVTAYIAAPVVLPTILGARWAMAGEYVRWLLPMTCMALAISQVNHIYIIARQQKRYLGIQIMLFLASVVGLGGAGWYGCSAGEALIFWGVLTIPISIFSVYGGWRIANGVRK